MYVRRAGNVSRAEMRLLLKLYVCTMIMCGADDVRLEIQRASGACVYYVCRIDGRSVARGVIWWWRGQMKR